MKYFAAALFLFCFSMPAFAANRYSNGDTLHVLALSGLRLRDQPGGQTVLATLPYGATLMVQEAQPDDRNETVENIAGHWVLVNWQGRKGYVFDGFLSVLPAPSEKTKSLSEYCDQYFKKKGPLIDVKLGEEETTNDIGIQYYTYREMLIELKTNGYYESSSETLVIDPAYKVSPEEMYLLLKAVFRKEIAESINMIETGAFKPDEDLEPQTRNLDKNYYNFIPLKDCREIDYYLYSEVCYQGLKIGRFGYMIFIQCWGGC